MSKCVYFQTWIMCPLFTPKLPLGCCWIFFYNRYIHFKYGWELVSENGLFCNISGQKRTGFWASMEELHKLILSLWQMTICMNYATFRFSAYCENIYWIKLKLSYEDMIICLTQLLHSLGISTLTFEFFCKTFRKQAIA